MRAILLILILVSGCRFMDMQVVKDTDQKIDSVEDIFGGDVELDKNCTDWAESILPSSIIVDRVDEGRFLFSDEEIYWKDGTMLFFNKYLKNVKILLGEDGLYYHTYTFGSTEYPFEYRSRAVDENFNVLGYNLIKLKPSFNLSFDQYPYEMEIADPNIVDCRKLD